MAASHLPSAAAEELHRLRAEAASALAIAQRERQERIRLEKAIIAAAENEQNRLAQMLHDTVCQSLSGIHLLARLIARRLQSTYPEAGREVAELSEVIHRSVGELHDLASWLRPADPDAPTLVPALWDLSRLAGQRVPCKFVCPEPVVIADRYASVQLLQMAQQAVNDALQYARAQQLTLSLVREDELVILTVQDDGAAAAAKPQAGRITGQELLAHRASVIGAQVTFSADPHAGTTIQCKLPLNR